MFLKVKILKGPWIVTAHGMRSAGGADGLEGF
jgi:hypothetical protein